MNVVVADHQFGRVPRQHPDRSMENPPALLDVVARNRDPPRAQVLRRIRITAVKMDPAAAQVMQVVTGQHHIRAPVIHPNRGKSHLRNLAPLDRHLAAVLQFNHAR